MRCADFNSFINLGTTLFICPFFGCVWLLPVFTSYLGRRDRCFRPRCQQKIQKGQTPGDGRAHRALVTVQEANSLESSAPLGVVTCNLLPPMDQATLLRRNAQP